MQNEQTLKSAQTIQSEQTLKSAQTIQSEQTISNAIIYTIDNEKRTAYVVNNNDVKGD